MAKVILYSFRSFPHEILQTHQEFFPYLIRVSSTQILGYADVIDVITEQLNCMSRAFFSRSNRSIFERKVLKMISGAICVNSEWRIRYND
uniref:Uncharacterized protein n=1 Tax=Megaselia scalaris TaxID=36166 RepID=T1GFV1_MEGSC